MSAATPILTVEHVSMRFGGLVAVDDLSFIARRGDITALIGPNGAGKTTVFNCVTGFYKPTEGRLALARDGVATHEDIAAVMIGVPELMRELDWMKKVFGEDFDPTQYRMLLFGAAMVIMMIWKPRGLVSTRLPSLFLKEQKAVSSDLVKEGHG